MKKCTACNVEVEENVKFCPNCGGSAFTREAPAQTPAVAVPTGNGNITAGVVGALLFALGGGALYFLITSLA